MSKETKEASLDEVVALLRLLCFDRARAVLASHFKCDDKGRIDATKRQRAIVFELLTSGKNRQELAVLAEVTPQAVGRWISEWTRLGLLTLSGIPLFTLQDFGFQMDSLPRSPENANEPAN